MNDYVPHLAVKLYREKRKLEKDNDSLQPGLTLENSFCKVFVFVTTPSLLRRDGHILKSFGFQQIKIKVKNF